MPETWGSSGARLALPITVDFTSTPFRGEGETLVGRTAFGVDVVGGSCKFVGEKGEVEVDVEGGGWSVEPPKLGEVS